MNYHRVSMGRHIWTGLVVIVMVAVTACGGPETSGSPSPTSAASGKGSPSPSSESPGDAQTQNAAGASLHQLLPAEIQSSGVVRLGGTFNYPPFSYTSEDGEPDGLDVELATAVAERLGIQIKWVHTSFPQLPAGLKTGRYDAIWSAFRLKKRLLDQFNFISYVSGAMSLLVQDGNPVGIKKITDFCGQRIITTKGAAEEVHLLKSRDKWCQEHGKDGIEIEKASEDTTARLAVRQGRVAGFLIGFVANAYTAKERPEVYDNVGPFGNEPTNYCVVVPKNRTQLREAFVAGLHTIMSNGTYERILSKWNLKRIGLDHLTINAGAIEPKVLPLK